MVIDDQASRVSDNFPILFFNSYFNFSFFSKYNFSINFFTVFIQGNLKLGYKI